MKSNLLPIGFYDSGVGGISVLKETIKLLPHENYIYFGDMANAPYGTKTQDDIRECSLQCGDFLFKKGVKAIVIACNTATSIVVSTMRENYRIPIISIEPAIKPALEKYARGKVLVLATPATLEQQRYHSLKLRLDTQNRVLDVACEGLATLIENHIDDQAALLSYLVDKLTPYQTEEVCGLVIGCTHYSFISDVIAKAAKQVLSGPLELFDGMYGTAKHVVHVLQENHLLNTSVSKGKVEFFTSMPSQQDSITKMKQFFNK